MGQSLAQTQAHEDCAKHQQYHSAVDAVATQEGPEHADLSVCIGLQQVGISNKVDILESHKEEPCLDLWNEPTHTECVEHKLSDTVLGLGLTQFG